MIIAGVDIGNSTTEICICKVSEDQKLDYLSSASLPTTGLKGTPANIKGIEEALKKATDQIGFKLSDIDLIRLNEATPVIGDTAMETITETIISESTMIGHNPNTPAGQGLAVGETVQITNLGAYPSEMPYIVKIPGSVTYEQAAVILNTSHANVVGAILEKDEAVLVYNRLVNKIPIVDEVSKLDQLPDGIPCAIEVAHQGGTVTTLSNPYGIAKLFNLTPEETRTTIPVAKSLTGLKSAVVAKTSHGGVTERMIKAGQIGIEAESGTITTVNVDDGAKAIMESLAQVKDIKDIHGQPGTYFYDMLVRMKGDLEDVAGKEDTLSIKDLVAIDTFIPVKVKGALAGELAMEKAVAIAAMVKTDHLPMGQIASGLKKGLGIDVEVAGVEAVMAVIGALTTPGTKLPIAILDLGGGSTDGALLDQKGRVASVHLAGAGAFVTMMINEELALHNLQTAELIKKYPLAKVRSLYHITMENGQSVFYKEPLPPKLYAKVVILKDKELIPIESSHTMEFIIETRRQIKEKVFVTNSIRALEEVAPGGRIKSIPNVVLVGGSALDHEIPQMIQKRLADYNIVAGRGDIWSLHGPRNAVAAGLCISYNPD